ncbi:MAG TPA: hypothetical protein VKE74_06145 [Gemmataceae bacterium]|nr:hypothetical protein [Gemmataceae bacterium]
MDVDQLTHLASEPDTHRLIVGDYDGSYALGVTGNPPAFLLRVEPRDVGRFPKKVTIDGAEIPVIVEGGFRQPKPQRR